MHLDFQSAGLMRMFVGTLLLIVACGWLGEGMAQDKAPPPKPGGAGKGKIGKVGVESDMPFSVAYSPRGTAVAAAGYGGAIKVWDPRTGALRHTLPGPNRSIRRALAFSPDGNVLAVGGDDSAVHLFDVRTGEIKLTFGDHLGGVMGIAFSPDGRTLAAAAHKSEIMSGVATGKTAGEIRLWDVSSGKIKQTWQVPKGLAYTVAFSPDGNSLASAEGPVRVRDVTTGAVKQTFTSERGGVLAVAFSPDGKELAGGGGYSVQVGAGTRSVGELRVWEVGSGKLRLTRTDMHSSLRCVAFSPNGQMLAAGSDGPIKEERFTKWISSELRLWDMRTGELLRTVEGKLGGTQSLAFSPDGRMILSCDHREVVLTESSTGLRRATIMTVTERLMK